MNNRIFINGVIGIDTKLLDVIRQYKSLKNPTSIEVIIDSVGGYVIDGENIYSYLKNLPIEVTTIAHKAYSIAAQIFMAGSKRLVVDNSAGVMIHCPLVQNITGNSTDLDFISSSLKETESKFVDFYSNALNIDKATVLKLLQQETFFSAKEALEIGLSTGIKQQELQAVALYHKQTTTNNNMNKKEVTTLFKASTDVTDATGEILTFPDVDTDSTPAVGDKATGSDGTAIDGEILLPDGVKYIFENGELKEIIPAASEEEEETNPALEDAPVAVEIEPVTLEDGRIITVEDGVIVVSEIPAAEEEGEEEETNPALEEATAELAKELAEVKDLKALVHAQILELKKATKSKELNVMKNNIDTTTKLKTDINPAIKALSKLRNK